MSRIDGTSEIEKVQTEKIEPEKCENVEDFEKALDKRMDQLKEETEASRHCNAVVEILTQEKSPEEVQKLKADSAGKLDETREAFQEACFGEHKEMSNEDRAKMVASAKFDWECAVTNDHISDMALERQEGTSDKPLDWQDSVLSEGGGLSFKEKSYMALTALNLGMGLHENVQRLPLEPIPIESQASDLADAHDIEHEKDKAEGESFGEALLAEKDGPAEVGKPPYEEGLQPFTATQPNGETVTVNFRMPEDGVNTSDKEN